MLLLLIKPRNDLRNVILFLLKKILHQKALVIVVISMTYYIQNIVTYGCRDVEPQVEMVIFWEK